MDCVGNLGVFSDIKQALLQDILMDEKCVKLLKNSGDVTLPALDLRYTQVVPWKRIPGVVEEEKSFVTFDIRIPEYGTVSKATRQYQLEIYAMAPERMMVVDNTVGKKLDIPDRGTRIDLLADRIDYLINGSHKYTFDEMQFAGSETLIPHEGFFARMIRYNIRGWNMAGDKIAQSV